MPICFSHERTVTAPWVPPFFLRGNPWRRGKACRILCSRFPGLLVAGCYSAAFRPLPPRRTRQNRGDQSRGARFRGGLGHAEAGKWMADQSERSALRLSLVWAAPSTSYPAKNASTLFGCEIRTRVGVPSCHRPRRLARRYIVDNSMLSCERYNRGAG